MTDTTKTRWTLAGLVAAVILAGTAWPSLLPVLEWLAPIFARDQVQAVMAALAGGVLLGAWLPHLLPRLWSPARTQVVSGVACALLTFGIALALVSTRTGFVYAVLAAVATPTVSRAIAGLVYHLKPAVKPESLQP